MLVLARLLLGREGHLRAGLPSTLCHFMVLCNGHGGRVPINQKLHMPEHVCFWGALRGHRL